MKSSLIKTIGDNSEELMHFFGGLNIFEMVPRQNLRYMDQPDDNEPGLGAACT